MLRETWLVPPKYEIRKVASDKNEVLRLGLSAFCETGWYRAEMSRFFGTTVFLLLGVCITLSGQTPPLDEPYCDAKTAKKLQIADADAKILGFQIGRTSLKDVEAKLGPATPRALTREEESDEFICYVSPADGTVLAFYSGAMGGWTDVTHFAFWSRGSAPPTYSRCTSSALVTRDLSTESGLRLGLSREDVARLAGNPTRSGRDSEKREYLCKLKMTADEIKRFKAANDPDVSEYPYFDRTSWIDVAYSNSKTSHIEVGDFESY